MYFEILTEDRKAQWFAVSVCGGAARVLVLTGVSFTDRNNGLRSVFMCTGEENISLFQKTAPDRIQTAKTAGMKQFQI